MKLIDIKGNKYERLTVLRKMENSPKWECRCDCGNTIAARGTDLRRGLVKSCGCLRKETAANNGRTQTTHGLRNTRLYKEWIGMKTRCYNPNSPSYADYGGRGIEVCEEWRDDFYAFFKWAMASGYDPTAVRGECTIDREDNSGNYSPENCRWITNREQQNNKRNNRLITYNGQTKTIPQWAAEVGISANTIHNRIRRGWHAERAITEPIHEEKQRS